MRRCFRTRPPGRATPLPADEEQGGTGACPRLQEKAGKHKETGTGTDCCAAGASPSHDTSWIAWAKLLARVGEEFPLACPNCGGDIRPIAFITDPGPIHATAAGRSRLPSNRRFASGQWPRWHCLREAEPPPVSPARGPPTDSGEFVQVHHDREVLQSSPEELPVIDIHSLCRCRTRGIKAPDGRPGRRSAPRRHRTRSLLWQLRRPEPVSTPSGHDLCRCGRRHRRRLCNGRAGIHHDRSTATTGAAAVAGLPAADPAAGAARCRHDSPRPWHRLTARAVLVGTCPRDGGPVRLHRRRRRCQACRGGLLRPPRVRGLGGREWRTALPTSAAGLVTADRFDSPALLTTGTGKIRSRPGFCLAVS